MFNTYNTGTYDVQSVSGRAIADGLELSCTFAEGSQAQSCILLICSKETGFEGSCVTTTIFRNPHDSLLMSIGQITSLQPGLYLIRALAEVERDGELTSLRRKTELELELLIYPPPQITTSITSG